MPIPKTSRHFQTLLSIFLVFGLLLLSSGCSRIREAQDASLRRATLERLEDYVRDEKPKDMIKWFFRYERKKPDLLSLEILETWSRDNRWLFIKLLDKLEGEWRDEFITSYADMLVRRELVEDFRSRYAESDSRSFNQLRQALEVLEVE